MDVELRPVETLEHLAEDGHREHRLTCLTRAELKQTRLVRLDEPRRCANGHLCVLWPCLSCNPFLGFNRHGQ